jgi:hypothetical protein
MSDKRGWKHPYFNQGVNKLEIISHQGGAREFPDTRRACWNL